MIELRHFRLQDLSSLVKHADNPKVSRYLRERFPSPFTEADGKWWIEEGSRQPNSVHYAIIHDGEFVGAMGATFFYGERKHSAEVGYWLGEAFWGRGIVVAALKLFIEELFAREGIVRLFAPVVGPNVASMRVLEKCGFVREGVLRNGVMLRGEVYDEHVFGLLK